MKSSVRKSQDCPNCCAMIQAIADGNLVIVRLKAQIEQLERNLQSVNAREANAKNSIQRSRLSKPLRGQSPKNAVQADMIAGAIDRAIGVKA